MCSFHLVLWACTAPSVPFVFGLVLRFARYTGKRSIMKHPFLRPLSVLALAFAFAFLVLTSSFGRADDTAEIWRKIKASDEVASQGSIACESRMTLMNWPSVAQEVEAHKKHLAKQGLSPEDIERKNLKAEVEGMQKQMQETTKEVWIYARDQRFVRTIGGQGRSEIKQIYDGQDALMITQTGGKTSVRITAGKPLELHGSRQLIGLYPGPCFVLGRGLSALQDVRVVSSPEPTVEGRAIDGSLIKAVLDSKHDYIAKRIERRNQRGGLVGVMTLRSPTLSEDGLWVAGETTYETYWQGNSDAPSMRSVYRLLSAHFFQPDNQTFQFPLQQGLTIFDDRLGNSVMFEKTKPGEISKEALLPLTRRRLADIARLKAQTLSYERAALFKRIALFGLPLLLLLGVFGMRLLRRRLRAA